MLLQVHDELVFEAPEAEAEATIALAGKVMSQAPRRWRSTCRCWSRRARPTIGTRRTEARQSTLNPLR